MQFNLTGEALVNGRRSAEQNLTIPPITLINIYPNPVKSQFTLQLNNEFSGRFTAQLINSNGAVVQQLNLSKAPGIFQHQLLASDIPAGYYILKIKIQQNTYYKKILKQ
jgi:hypothetical protein